MLSSTANVESLAGSILIAGAGTMGRQIAATFALNGATDIRIVDPSAAQRESARGWIDDFFDEAGHVEYSARIELLAEHHLPDESVVLAIEAVPEVAELKRIVLLELMRAAPSATITSNSSSMPVSRFLEDDAPLGRVANLHFYVRPWERKVVELMTSGASEDYRLKEVKELLELLGFRVFVLRRPSFGLLYNRIWAAIKREALAIVDEGVAEPFEVDEICRALDPRPARGPFERMDAVGLDTVELIEQSYADELGTVVSRTLEELVSRGRLGQKSGSGFFDYPDVLKEG